MAYLIDHHPKSTFYTFINSCDGLLSTITEGFFWLEEDYNVRVAVGYFLLQKMVLSFQNYYSIKNQSTRQNYNDN
jgi:hypothetical protein